MDKSLKKTFAAAVLCGLFLVLILLLRTVDVKAIGPNGSYIGLAALNGAFFKLTGQIDILYKLSEIIGYVALLTAVFFAFLGLLQLIKGKKLSAVDKDLYLLGAFYVVVLAFYLLFEKFVINYRPVLEDGQLAASFPSSHTMLGITFLGAAALEFKNRLNDAKLRRIVVLACQGLVLLIVLLRLFCGWHWLTDVIGGILIGSALLLAFSALQDHAVGKV